MNFLNTPMQLMFNVFHVIVLKTRENLHTCNNKK